MATMQPIGNGRFPWRAVLWSGAALILLAPLVAMQFTPEVDWTASDFGFAAALVLSAGAAGEWAARRRASRAYRAAAALAIGTACLLVWGNAAVGVLGSGGTPLNAAFSGVPLVALAGGAVARFRPRGFALALVATAAAQLGLAVAALAAGQGFPGRITLFFGALWLACAWLFQRAQRDEGAAAR